jgi:hypothetical protein
VTFGTVFLEGAMHPLACILKQQDAFPVGQLSLAWLLRSLPVLATPRLLLAP